MFEIFYCNCKTCVFGVNVNKNRNNELLSDPIIGCVRGTKNCGASGGNESNSSLASTTATHYHIIFCFVCCLLPLLPSTQAISWYYHSYWYWYSWLILLQLSLLSPQLSYHMIAAKSTLVRLLAPFLSSTHHVL